VPRENHDHQEQEQGVNKLFQLQRIAKLSVTLILNIPCSSDLNSIELIWKELKRIVSRTFIQDCNHITELLETNFLI